MSQYFQQCLLEVLYCYDLKAVELYCAEQSVLSKYTQRPSYVVWSGWNLSLP